MLLILKSDSEMLVQDTTVQPSLLTAHACEGRESEARSNEYSMEIACVIEHVQQIVYVDMATAVRSGTRQSLGKHQDTS